MQKLHFTTVINAPREKVWDTMLGDVTYRIWTEVFHAGSYFEGDWSEGSEIKFIGPGEDGKLGGLAGKVVESRRPEFVSVEYYGFVSGNEVVTEGEEVSKWVGALESYTFNAVEGGTEVLVDLDTAEDMSSYFAETWPKALEKLKELAEK